MAARRRVLPAWAEIGLLPLVNTIGGAASVPSGLSLILTCTTSS